MSRRQQHDPSASPLRFRTSPSPAPAALFGNGGQQDDERPLPPPLRVNMALSGWLQDRLPPLPLASLSSSASSSAAAAPTQRANPQLASAAALCFELADARTTPTTPTNNDNKPVPRRRPLPRVDLGPPPEAPDAVVAALNGLPCSACDAPLVPSPGETSEQRRRRAAALTRVCAGCRQAFHAGCAREVGKLLGGRMVLRHVPGTPMPWDGEAGGADGGGALLAAMAGRRPLPSSKQRAGETRQQQAERLVREQEVVDQAIARDGHWFHSYTCARVGQSLAAQAARPAVPIDPLPSGAADGRGDGGGGGDAKNHDADGNDDDDGGGPFAWLKSMRRAERRRLEAMFKVKTSSPQEAEAGDKGEGGAKEGEGKQDKQAQETKAAAAAKARTTSAPASSSSRTWALVDLSRLRAEPGDPPGRKGSGSGLRPDVNALIDVLVQAYGPGAADEIVGLTAAAAGRDDDDASGANGGANGGAGGGGPRRRVGGGVRDGRYAVLLRDSPNAGSAPLCAALLESYGAEAATIGLVATRVSRRGEGHAAALLDATALFLREGLGTRKLLAAGAPVASDPVCRGLFLGKGGEKAVLREQARVQAELRRHSSRGGGGGAASGGPARGGRRAEGGGGDDGDNSDGGGGGNPTPGAAGSGASDLVAGLLAVGGSPSLAPYVAKERIYYSPPHAPRFRRLGRAEARELAGELPALGRRLGAGGALGRRGLFGWLLGAGVQDGEWLVRDLGEEA